MSDGDGCEVLCSACLKLLTMGWTAATLAEQQAPHVPQPKEEDEDEESKLSPRAAADPQAKKMKLSGSPVAVEPHPTLRVCVCCLGMASEAFIQNTLDSIMEAFCKEHYVGLKSFNLAVSAPLCALIRKAGVCAYLKSLHKNVASLEDTFVKEYFKSRLRTLLKQRLALSYEIEGQLQLEVRVDHTDSKCECEALAKIVPGAFSFEKTSWKMRQKHPDKHKARVLNISAVSIRKAIEQLDDDVLAKHDFLVPKVEAKCQCNIEFFRRPVFMAGRYNKYSRELPQTPWLVDGVRKAESSVQELITNKMVECVRASDLKFSSSGREDCDVRMLGTGRPFLVELIQPKTFELTEAELLKLEKDINASSQAVAVRQLKVVSKTASALLKLGEEKKRKEYTALVWTSEAITPQAIECLSAMKDVELAQKTPIRVLHRRTLTTRMRTVYSMQASYISEHRFSLALTTQAGTYVKEFVHSDFGRTKPSLCDLMKQEVDILSLDVEEVLVDWPPPLL